MKRLYLVDKQVNELSNCIRARICQLSSEMNRLKGLEKTGEIYDRIETLSTILEVLSED